jgi:ADP-ribose pyrophosphatase
VKVNSLEKITDQSWMNLYDAKYTNNKGEEASWIYASRNKNLKLGQILKPDAVIIIPIFKDEKDKTRKLIVTKEFRVPINGYEYGFPAGLIEQNEKPIDVARRELKEETGLKLTKVFYVGPSSVSSAGLSDESIVYVVCECEGEISNKGNEASEDISVEAISHKKLENWLRIHTMPVVHVGENVPRPQFISAKALPFMLLFQALDKITWPKHMRNVPN